MEEKIGRVTLDLSCYPGEDLYSDGPVEEELLQIAENYKEEELNQVIAQKGSWPVLYHFSHIRQNILEWLPITKEDKVLEIGSGCGAITGALARKAGQVTCIELSKMRSTINAYRNRDYDNIHILVGNFQDIEKNLTETYDYITLIGVFEYAEGYIGTREPYVEMLRRIAGHLKKDGALVIAIENRLGLKYWAGCTEDHVGKYFEGLEGYPKTKGVKTFSRKELFDVIRQAGDFRTTFYYPYPDYKFPLTLYSDKYLPKKGDLTDNFCNYDRVRMQLFDEPKVYDSLVDAGLFPEFSNSFFTIVKKEENPHIATDSTADAQGGKAEIIYSKYSNERSRSFAVRTDILEQGGTRFVRKQPLYPEGQEHVENLCRWYEALQEEYEKAGLSCNRCEKDEEGVRLEYLEGKTLEELLDGLLEKGETKKAAGYLDQYLKQVKTICSQEMFQMTDDFRKVFGEELPSGEFACAKVTNIDMVCQNLVLTDPPCVLDYEWTFAFPVPCDFVLYRIIHYYIETHSVRKALSEYDFYEKAGITRERKELFARMEANFQRYITGKHIPMRDMFADITPGVGVMEMVGGGMLQVFFSFGEGYQEKNSRTFPLEEGRGQCSLTLPENCVSIRIDPGDLPCAVHLEKLAFDGKPADVSKAAAEQGSIFGEWAYIAKDDPNISEIPVPPGAKCLEISLKVYAAAPEMLENLKEQGCELIRLKEKTKKQAKLIRDMQNTKVWKFYQSYRNKIERKK